MRISEFVGAYHEVIELIWMVDGNITYQSASENLHSIYETKCKSNPVKFSEVMINLISEMFEEEW